MEPGRVLIYIVMLMLAGFFKLFFLVFCLIDVKTKVDIREFLNLNSPGLVMLSAGIMCVVSLTVSGKSYCSGYGADDMGKFPGECGAPS